MTLLRRRSASTTVTYDVVDPDVLEQPDTGALRPEVVTVTIDWTSGAASVETSGWARVVLDHYNDAAQSEWRIVRDAVGQACIDHDKRNI